MVTSGYVETDCLLVSNSFHLTGQLTVFKFRVENVVNDIYVSQGEIQKLVFCHHPLIRS